MICKIEEYFEKDDGPCFRVYKYKYNLKILNKSTYNFNMLSVKYSFWRHKAHVSLAFKKYRNAF